MSEFQIGTRNGGDAAMGSRTRKADNELNTTAAVPSASPIQQRGGLVRPLAVGGEVPGKAERQSSTDLTSTNTAPQARETIDDEIGTIATAQAVKSARVRKAKRMMDARERMPSAPNTPPAGEGPEGSAQPAAGGEVQWRYEHQRASDLAPTILLLRQLQRTRRFCIVSQSRIDRSTEAFIALQWGLDRDAPEAERKKEWLKIAAFRKSVERDAAGQSGSVHHPSPAGRSPVDGGGHHHGESRATSALSICTPVILAAMQSRAPWDKVRNDAEKEMRRLGRTLPAWGFVEGVKGLSDLGLAIIIAETGDLSGYATKERVWKRLGLAVIEGERQRRIAGAEAAARHGYAPQRRAEIWSLCSDSMFRQQWRGAKDDVPAHPIGPYGEIYAKRKAHTETREGWSLARRDNDARRIMTKCLLEDLWRAWGEGQGDCEHHIARAFPRYRTDDSVTHQAS